MVEKPIKKSERAERSSEEAPAPSNRVDRGERGGNREGGERRGKGQRGERGKGRGGKREEEKKPPMPLALMRGPKPQPKVVAPPTEEPTPEEATEATEAVEETVEESA